MAPSMNVDTASKRAGLKKSGSGLNPRLALAVVIGRLAAATSRSFRLGGGTALPGVLAARIDPAILAKLARDFPRGVTLVTGTNGKTTSSRLLAAMLGNAGWTPIHNRSGSNLASGLTTALIQVSDLAGHPRGDSGLFEVDEAVIPRVLAALRPRVVVLTNLFRDQLDRYGEVDFVAGLWRGAVKKMTPDTTLVLNADDPGVAALGRESKARVVYYGIDAALDSPATVGHVADSKNCPVCGTPLHYEVVRYAHVGTYRCPNGDFSRPAPDVSARTISLHGINSTEIEVVGPFGIKQWQFKLPGLYNAYNLLAAVAGAHALGVPIEAIDRGIDGFSAAFGRLERIRVGDRTLFFVLVKNPVGFTEVLRTILVEPGSKHLAIFINDNLADGTDVSWLWDAEVEPLASRCERVQVSGTRAGDMAVRLKYAGVPDDRIHVAREIEAALDAALSTVPADGTLYVLPTYTAMLDLRALVSRRGYASHFWED